MRAYRNLVRHLIYLNTTKSNITHATQQLSQYMYSPTEKLSQGYIESIEILEEYTWLWSPIS